MRRACITGGAGFIGSTLADRLNADGVEVVVDRRLPHRSPRVRRRAARAPWDAPRRGRRARPGAARRCVRGLRLGVPPAGERGRSRMGSSIRAATSSRTRSRPSTVLEAMRAVGTTKIAFSSTGSVYGEPEVFPTPEDAPFPIQTSLYAASKLAGEGMIAAYAHGYGVHGSRLSLRLDPRRALHARARLRLLPRLEARPDAPARARRRPSGEVVSLRAGLRLRDPDGGRRARRRCRQRPTSTTSAPTRRSSSTTRWR